MVTIEMVSDLADSFAAEAAKLRKLREDEEGLPCDLGMSQEEWDRLERRMEEDAISWWVDWERPTCECCGSERCDGVCQWDSRLQMILDLGGSVKLPNGIVKRRKR
jgi:hypothetical protein